MSLDSRKVIIFAWILCQYSRLSVAMWKCNQAGYSVVPEQKIRHICSSSSERQRNSVHHVSNVSMEQVQDIMLSSVVLIKMKVERMFSKKVAWTSCVGNEATGKCGSEFCQMIARKHFLQVFIECMMMYPTDDNNPGSCTHMYKRIYISSFCAFHGIHINREYLLFASEVTLESNTNQQGECNVISDITYSYIYEYNVQLFENAMPTCTRHSNISEYTSNASDNPFSKTCKLPYSAEMTPCRCAKLEVLMNLLILPICMYLNIH